MLTVLDYQALRNDMRTVVTMGSGPGQDAVGQGEQVMRSVRLDRLNLWAVVTE